MASVVKEISSFQIDIRKLKGDLQRESSFIRRVALGNISWHSLPMLSSQLSDGWALSGRFSYQVDNSLCESFDLLAVALMSGDLQYTHELPPSRLDALSVALSEHTESGSWRSPFSSEPNDVPQHLSQLSIMWIPMQLFVIPVENCASELATLMSNDWLTFVMAMEGGGEVYSHGKLSLPQHRSNQESTIQSTTVAETSATLSHRSESEYLMALSSLRLLTQEELQGYNSQELRLMRNEIFARHGYRFKSQDLTRFFSEKSWYKPTTTEVTLSSIEAENVKLIKSLE
ncbi:YARHG domain-containing protein [Vibrio sp. 404]|uniref:YARHG domain-containing protein n=2 Tax=Vibrio marinisediminis TaxID=2758441 RepID=A0A7W2FQQ2_9VIBR|nr:YARHG domain-containing protein [Vibrio marinisediminis]